MADSDALRAKRRRHHKSGDHRLCRSETCADAVTTSRSDDTAVTIGVTLNDAGRGARLWTQMNEGRGLAPTHVVLLEEACRLADRLDRLDAMLEDPRRAWLNFEVSEDGAEITVTIDRLLSETRMQETTLKGLVDSLTRALEDTGAGAPPVTTPQQHGGGGNVVGLRSRIAEKRAQTAG